MSRILGFIIASLLLISMAHASFAPSVSLDTEKQTYYEQVVDTVLDRYVAQRSEATLQRNFPIIRGRIANALRETGLPDEIIYFLEYLDRYIASWLTANPETVEEENTTSTNTSSSSTSTSLNINSYDEGEKTLGVGSDLTPVAKFSFTARLEGVEVDRISLIASDDNFAAHVAKAYLYDEDGTLLASDRPSGDTATFRSSFEFDEGQHDLYIALEAVDNEALDASYTFDLLIEDPEGMTTWDDIDSIRIRNNDDEVHVVTVALGNQGISIHPSFQRYYVDQKIYNQAKTDLAIISIDIAGSTTNTDSMLSSLEFTLVDGTVAKDVHTTLKLQRIDTLSDKITPSSVNGSQITFDLSDLWGKAEVNNGSTAVFMVTGTPILDPTISESIAIKLDTAETTQGIFTYTTEESNQRITTKGLWFLGESIVYD